MPRRRRFRRIMDFPRVNYFKPAGVELRKLEEVILTIEEWEAVRLTDFELIEQKEAAKKMKISQPTLHRTLKSARKKITEALVKGKALRIEGGDFEIKKS